jgi:large repetitive protein
MRSFSNRAAVACTLLAITLWPASARADANTWVSGGTMTTPRFLHVAAQLAGGLILVAGGTDDITATATKSTEIYFPGDSFWQPAANMNVPRFQSAAAAVPRDSVLVAGGNSTQSVTTALSTAEVFDHTANTWTLTANTMSSPRGQFPTATRLPNDMVLVAGGAGTSGAPVATADLYSPFTNSFTPAASMHSARFGATATLLANGNVLVAGGGDASGNATSSAEVYDPQSDSWSPVSNSMSSPRLLARAAVLPSGKVLIAGGESQLGLGVTRSTDIYDPVANSFTPGPSMSTPRALFGLSPLGDGRVAAIGGLNIDGIGQPSIVSGVEVLGASSNSWSLAASLPAPATDFTSTPLLTGQVLVAGGTQNLNTGTTTAELFNPPAPGRGIAERPSVRLSGVPRRLKLARFLRGITFSVTPSTAVRLQASLLGSANRATLARALNLTLVSRRFGLSAKRRTLKLVPPRRLVGSPRHTNVQLVLVATDAAGTSSTSTRVISVSR